MLDISNNIEQCSEDWPIDPDGNSVILSNSSVEHYGGMHLAHPFGKPKRLLIELFIMVNMAQLMYTAMLAFAKSAMLTANARGTATSSLAMSLYRSVVLLLIEVVRHIIACNSKQSNAKEALDNDKADQYNSPMYTAWLTKQEELRKA